MTAVIRLVLVLVMLTYPFIVYWGLKQGQIRWLVVIVLTFAIIRLLLSWKQKEVISKVGDWLTALVGVVLALLVLRSSNSDYFLYYPVLINAVFLFVFGASLRWPPTVIERLARLQDPNLPPEAVIYTRNVTIIWCAFFVFNGLVSLITISMGMAAWAMYNGLIAYLLMGLLFVGEFAYRKLVLKK